MSMIAVKIDVTKIDKAKLFAGKNGAKYLDIVLMEKKDGPDQYGDDFMVVQSVSKEEREAGKRGAILGNGRYIGRKSEPEKRPAQTQRPPPQPSAADEDDIPF